MLKARCVCEFGSQAPFRWKGKSCLECQDEFLHCTDPGLEQERINVTFRWIRQHTPSPFAGCGSMSSANVYAGFFLYCYGDLGFQRFGCIVGAPWGFVCMGCSFCWCFPSYSKGLGYGGVPFAGHAFLAKVGGSIIFVILGEFPGSHKKVLLCFYGREVIPGILCCIC